MRKQIAVVLCSAVLGSLPASAHHALTAYDRSISKTVEGVVKDFMFANPHARLILLVESPDGMKEWDFEGGSVRRLTQRGFTASTVAKGDKIKVSYNPMRSRPTGGFFLGLTTPEGKYLGQR